MAHYLIAFVYLWVIKKTVTHLNSEAIDAGLFFVVEQFGNNGAVLWKIEFAKRHADNFVFEPVLISDNEFATTEFRIPADAVEEVLNGDHDSFTCLQGF